MKVVIQLAASASVSVVAEEEKMVSKIGPGFVILVGLSDSDTEEKFDSLINKIIKLRVFPDEEGRMNKALGDIEGEVLLVSQFTLYADCKKGNRPSFIKAMRPDKAESVYATFVSRFKELYSEEKVKDGEFGAHMKVALVNDGPVTIILDV